jgi:hypothetical protein
MYSAGVGFRGCHAIAKNTMIRYLSNHEQLKKITGDALISPTNSAEYGNVTKHRGESCQRQCHQKKSTQLLHHCRKRHETALNGSSVKALQRTQLVFATYLVV